MFTRVPPSMRKATLRVLVVIAAAALVAFGPRPALADTTTSDPAPAAAGWLARQMVDGQRFESVFDKNVYWDQGLTIDAIFAFAAAGAAGENAQKAIDWLDDPVVADNYYGSYDTDPKTVTAGALAKLILAAQVTGKDPSNFAGVDLVSLLVTLQKTTGRFADTGPYDYVNAIGQSLATIALARAGDHDKQVESAASFLLGIKCDDGGWPLLLVTTATGCDSQVDSTAMVVQALLAAGKTNDAAKGLDWLVSKQRAAGGFSDESAAPVNANSTGLGAQALRAGGRDAEADKAVAFLVTLQVGCDGVAANRGAVAYDANGFNASTATRATAQAILGVGGVGLAKLTTAGAAAKAPTLLCAASTTNPTVTSAPSGGSGTLPITGTSLTLYLVAGFGLVLAGGGLVVVGRLRRHRADA